MSNNSAFSRRVPHARFARAVQIVLLAVMAATSAYLSVFMTDASAVVPPGERILDSSFEGTPPNLPPSLDAIGPQSIDLGSSLVINLSGSDPEAEPFFFGVLPNPDNASLDALTGEFIFSPQPEQVGLVEVTFTISDGIASDSQLVEITVNGAPPGGITMLSGRVLDTTDFVDDGTETAVVGATV